MCSSLDKPAVVGRRPRSDEYNPAITALHEASARAAAAALEDNYLARPHRHYSDYAQVHIISYHIRFRWLRNAVRYYYK